MSWTLPAARTIPAHVGIEGNRFIPSPANPNFVNSQLSPGRLGYVEPLRYRGTRDHARAAVLAVLEDDPRATLKTAREDYVHAEFQAMVFVDDVEFYFPEGDEVVHVRSGSRVGRSDLGANKRRYRKLAAAFASRV